MTESIPALPITISYFTTGWQGIETEGRDLGVRFTRAEKQILLICPVLGSTQHCLTIIQAIVTLWRG